MGEPVRLGQRNLAVAINPHHAREAQLSGDPIHDPGQVIHQATVPLGHVTLPGAMSQHGRVLLKACLNGTRGRAEHPMCPLNPEELAEDGHAAVRAGAGALHIHPRREDGAETLEASHVSAALRAMRDRVSVPIGVTTGEWILPGPSERLRAVHRWTVLPDFASVNFHEPEAGEIAAALLERGVGVEAGTWTPHAAGLLARSGLADRCLRFLFEPMDETLAAATSTVGAIERVLDGVAPEVPRLLHGFETTAWPILDLAESLGYDTRIGLEDTVRLPDGELAADNAQLVRTAAARLAPCDPQ